MTPKTQFRIQFPSQKNAASFLADLNTLPGEAQTHQWLHTAQIVQQGHVERGRVWEIQLLAPTQVAQPLRRFAQKNSAFSVESKDLPGDEDFNGY